jgi:hypothetical protein
MVTRKTTYQFHSFLSNLVAPARRGLCLEMPEGRQTPEECTGQLSRQKAWMLQLAGLIEPLWMLIKGRRRKKKKTPKLVPRKEDAKKKGELSQYHLRASFSTLNRLKGKEESNEKGEEEGRGEGERRGGRRQVRWTEGGRENGDSLFVVER